MARRRSSGNRRTTKKQAPVEVTGDSIIAGLQEHSLDVYAARDAAQVVGWLHTGNYALNWAVSGRFNRGWPLGHCVEIFGDPSTGKSFLINAAIREAQRAGGAALLDDTEAAYNPHWAEQVLQVNNAHLAYYRSDTVAEHRNLLLAYADQIEALKLTEVRPFVASCDSLALLSTEHELENPNVKDMSRPGEIKKMYRVVGRRIAELPLVHLVTNHKIANIGSYFGGATTPGGGGAKYQASVRLDLRTPSRVKDKAGNYLGVIVTALVDKGRFTVPWKQVQLTIPFYQPVSPYSGLIPVLLRLGVLQIEGHNLVLDGEDTGIRAHKSKEHFLLQDISGQQLVEQYPDLLQRVDEWFELNEREVGAINATTGEVEEEDVEEEE